MFSQKKKKKGNGNYVIKGLAKALVVIILQHISVSNHLRLAQCHMSIASQWSWGKRFCKEGIVITALGSLTWIFVSHLFSTGYIFYSCWHHSHKCSSSTFYLRVPILEGNRYSALNKIEKKIPALRGLLLWIHVHTLLNFVSLNVLAAWLWSSLAIFCVFVCVYLVSDTKWRDRVVTVHKAFGFHT